MDWWIRFSFGLPCRPEDAEHVRRHFPELVMPETEITPRSDWPFFWYAGHPRHIIPAIQSWVRSAEKKGRNEPERSAGAGLDVVALGRCPAANCPLKPIEITPPVRDLGVGELKLDLILGGGNKAPKAAFLELVRKHHAKGDGVKQVIVTDPYLLVDTGETGEAGGYGNFVEYLDALGLKPGDNFELLLNPQMKRGAAAAREKFEQVVRGKYAGSRFESYPAKYKFHDRLYLVRDKKSVITGVFGPSLNGLESDAIVLMGEITDIKALDMLRKMFR